LPFEEFSFKFSKTCKKCNGKKYLVENDEITECSCQLKALIDYKISLIPVDSDFRSLDWDDYTGDTVREGKEHRVLNWQQARNLAFEYCFSKDSILKIGLDETKVSSEIIEKIINKRFSNSKILNRMKEGANLVLFGDSFSGKTLLAYLVTREVIGASVLLGDFDVKWVSFNTLINSLGFDRVNHQLIDEISYVDFLILDNVYIPQQGNYMKNILDDIFHERITKKMPILITGQNITNRKMLGDEFFRILNSNNTRKVILESNAN